MVSAFTDPHKDALLLRKPTRRMYPRLRAPAISLLLALGVAACGDGTGTTDALGSLDARAVADVADSLLIPLGASVGPIYSLRTAFPTIVEQGLSFQRAAADVVIPAGIAGSTFIYDPLTLDWSVDTTRTGAPADGVRVVWFLRDNAGNVVQPVTEGGYIDLTDEDSGGALSAIGIRIVAAADTGDVTLADLTESIVGDSAQGTETYHAAGFYGGGNRVVNFDAVTDVSGDTLTGHQTSVTYSMTSEGDSYAFSASVQQDSAGTANAWTYTGSITTGGETAELTLDLVDQDGSESGTGTLSYKGEPLVRLTAQGTSYGYTDIDGNRLSSSEQVEVDYLVRAILQTWAYAFLDLPLLFL